MPLIYEDRTRKDALYEVAQRMMTAARTAPKGHGTDNLIIAVAERDVIEFRSHEDSILRAPMSR